MKKRAPRHRGPIEHRVIFQSLRNRSRPEMLVHLDIRIAAESQASELFVTGYLEPDGVNHRIRMHWSPADLVGAVASFEKFGAPFLEWHARSGGTP